MKKIGLFAIILTILGVLMVYSASCIWADYKLNDSYYYLARQGLFAIIGILIMIFTSLIDPQIYKKRQT